MHLIPDDHKNFNITSMKKTFLLILLIMLCELMNAQSKKILIVATNIDSVGNNKSGTYLKEIAFPFKYFVDAGYEVDILTPKGGKTALYDAAKTPDSLAAIRDNALFIEKTNNSLAPGDIKVKDYIAVYYPGGHGQYFDVLTDERIAAIAAAVYENGGVLGAAGHGMSSWINIRLKNCEYLVKGKTITCFPQWAEKAWMNISGYGKLLPFEMEEIFKRRGAVLMVPEQGVTNNPSTTTIIDKKHRIVTGSFAFHAQWVATQMLKMIQEKK